MEDQLIIDSESGKPINELDEISKLVDAKNVEIYNEIMKNKKKEFTPLQLCERIKDSFKDEFPELIIHKDQYIENDYRIKDTKSDFTISILYYGKANRKKLYFNGNTVNEKIKIRKLDQIEQLIDDIRLHILTERGHIEDIEFKQNEIGILKQKRIDRLMKKWKNCLKIENDYIDDFVLLFNGYKFIVRFSDIEKMKINNLRIEFDNRIFLKKIKLTIGE